jgi:phosphomannomutase
MAAENELIVSVSGIRGVVGSSLTAEMATAFAAALATYTKGGRVLLSRDGRPSGTMLRHAALAGLLSTGCEVQDIGVAPTPSCGLAIRHLKAAAGLQITASHNPAQWNGLKLFGRDGSLLTPTEGERVRRLFEAGTFRRVAWQEIGTVVETNDAPKWHCARILELIDGNRIRGAGLKVFLDANGGAGGPTGRQLLDALGCRLVCQACDADGIFLHEPEPIPANLQTISPLVAEQDADIGLVLDPDADRLALVDETGRFVGEELTLALAVLFRLRQRPGPVVINMSTSRLVEDIAKKFGSPCYRSAVGEINVVEKMREVGAVIGGEGNGGVIDPRVGDVRDPFIGMGLILSLLAQTGQKLSRLAADLPSYTILKDKYTVPRDRLPALFANLRKRWPDAAVNDVDGLRLDWGDRWVHVRPSNTEPIVRVIAEAPRAEDAQRLCRDVGQALQ